jgi:hypothetical protein
LNSLTDLLADEGNEAIYPCIADLVVNGLQLSRFAPSDQVPNRQDITQYLAAWCRDARLSEKACRNWLSDYAVDTLLPISSSSPSSIRHSSKSNVEYVYRSMVPFVCEREDNRFRAQCNNSCRVYNEMQNKTVAVRSEALTATSYETAAAPSTNPVVSLKHVYQEQFRAATQIMRTELAKGTKKWTILDLLKQQGMKTRTGREWTYATLNAEIRKLGKAPEHETANGLS